MRLVIDCRLRFGVARLLRNIVPRLARLLDEITLLGDGALIQEWELDAPNVRVVPFRSRVYAVSEQLRFPYWLRKACDLLHIPHYNVPLGWRGPLAATINDLAHLSPAMPTTGPQRAYARFFIRRALRRSRPVLTLSQFSRGEIMRVFNVAPERIMVAYCGVDRTIFRPLGRDGGAPVPGCDAPYILTVTSLRPHKNVNGLLLAFRELRRRFDLSHHLVIVGQQSGFRLDAPPLALADDIERFVHFAGFVSDEALARLYSGCEVFVYPSLYEGFGLPPLEAMACGAPVVASNRASLPEVVGDAGLLVDPLDAIATAEAVHRVVSDAALRAQLSAAGVARAATFTWDRTADVYVQAFRRCLAS